MRTYEVVLYGTITRDIRRMECDAESEDDVRAACAEQFRTYRVHSIAARETGDGEGSRPEDPSPPSESK